MVDLENIIDRLVKKAEKEDNKLKNKVIISNLGGIPEEDFDVAYSVVTEELVDRGISIVTDYNLLANCASLGLYLNSIGQYKILTKGEEISLAKKVKSGDKKAFNEMVEGNLRLVVDIAKRYQGKGLDMMDLIQEGNLGLMKAVSLYDVDMGYRFSTYAMWWIKQSIYRAISNNSTTIRLPVYLRDLKNKIASYKSTFLISCGREPTYSEISIKFGLNVKYIRKVESIDVNILSIDTPIGYEDGILADILKDETVDVEGDIEESALVKDIKGILLRLSPRERYIINERFGFGTGICKTLEDIGNDLGITRERVRQIEKRSLDKIRESVETRKLEDYLRA